MALNMPQMGRRFDRATASEGAGSPGLAIAKETTTDNANVREDNETAVGEAYSKRLPPYEWSLPTASHNPILTQQALRPAPGLNSIKRIMGPTDETMIEAKGGCTQLNTRCLPSC